MHIVSMIERKKIKMIQLICSILAAVTYYFRNKCKKKFDEIPCNFHVTKFIMLFKHWKMSNPELQIKRS